MHAPALFFIRKTSNRFIKHHWFSSSFFHKDVRLLFSSVILVPLTRNYPNRDQLIKLRAITELRVYLDCTETSGEKVGEKGG